MAAAVNEEKHESDEDDEFDEFFDCINDTEETVDMWEEQKREREF